MRSMAYLVVLTMALMLGANVASADGPYDVNHYWHNPLDLKAYDPPGPAWGTDGTGDQLPARTPGRALGIYPPRPADPALLADSKAVRWPTLDKSEWEKYKNQYTIVPAR